MKQTSEILFEPYLVGMGPTFTLRTWTLDKREEYGRWKVGYQLAQNDEDGYTVLFQGNDYEHAHPTALAPGALRDLVRILAEDGDDGNPTKKQLSWYHKHADNVLCEAEGLEEY